jgi:hypothetical protein
LRYAPKTSFDPILGENVQVVDTRTKRVMTLFTGTQAWARAEQRCRELNDQEKDDARNTDVG